MAQFTISSRYGTTTFESNHTDQHQLYNRLKTLVSKQEIVNTHATRLVHGFQRFGSWKNGVPGRELEAAKRRLMLSTRGVS